MEVTVPIGRTTGKLKVQDLPPILMAKLAFPISVGVPETLNIKFPEPFLNVSADMLADNPVMPVELIVCPLYSPPFPPV